MRIKLLSPRSPSIRKQDIHMICRLFDSFHQSLHISDLRAVCGYRDCLGAWTFVGESIEGCAGLVAGGGFAGGYVDFRSAGLEEAGDGKDIISV